MKRQRINRLFLCIFSVMLALPLGCFLYICDDYPADTGAIKAFSEEMSASGPIYRENTAVYAPEEADIGFVFYPGGKVEHTAYEPLMLACAEKGILCVLVEMPGNLAVLDMDAADGIAQQYPQIKKWYIGGHSLGGSMAASYAAQQEDWLDGLILLASYSTADLTSGSMDVLSVYGSEDKVLNAEKYETYRTNLPTDFMEVIIEGGCHAGFGMYGPQDGDGIPGITSKEQILITADIIADFLLS